MRRTGIFTVLFTWFLTTAAFAQGSGSSEPIGQPSFPAGREGAFLITRTVKGTIADINADELQLVVEDKKGRRIALGLTTETEYKAAKKTELADKKDLTARDFHAGQPVRVQYVVETETAVEVRLLKK